MNLLKVFVFLTAGVGLSACQSINYEVGEAELTDSEQLRDAYTQCLSYVNFNNGTRNSQGFYSRHYEAFFYEPFTQKSFCYVVEGKHRMPTFDLQKDCKYCKLFATRGQVVWKGFKQADEYNAYNKVIQEAKNIELTYYFNAKFELGDKQKLYYKSIFLPKVQGSKHRGYILAVSPNGENYGWSHYSSYTSTTDPNGYFKAWRQEQRKVALAICNAQSKRDDCVIYADGKTVFD
ncbi:hypothetical protein [Curvivirga sp.]|uniref:hypothetical protein n=1 Tax=Curvivirga sp. TaxID=2856848 RepID=UPI003B5CC576